MKKIKLFLVISFMSLLLFSCKKEESKPETWQFTKLVNANLKTNGNILSLDFYQKKGNEWRIVQFERDDDFNFYLKSETAITPNANQLPTNNPNAFMTNDVKLFDANGDKVYNQGNLKWFPGNPVEFQSFNTLSSEFPDLPIDKKSISKFSAASYSTEQAYDNKPVTGTYIFYDFPNQKYLYYAFRTGSDLILEYNLSELCSTCGSIKWKDIDAVACSDDDVQSSYFFFDFDAQKFYFASRIKNTNSPYFLFEISQVYDFADVFKGISGTPEEFIGFDFSK